MQHHHCTFFSTPTSIKNYFIFLNLFIYKLEMCTFWPPLSYFPSHHPLTMVPWNLLSLFYQFVCFWSVVDLQHHIITWSWWWTGRPGLLQSMGSQRVRQDWVTEQNLLHNIVIWYISRYCKTGKAMAPHSSTLAWRIPWMEEPGRLQSMGSLRVWHSWVTSLSLFTFTHWRRKWQPTPVFLPGESQGRESLVGWHLWGHTESDTTEAT